MKYLTKSIAYILYLSFLIAFSTVSWAQLPTESQLQKQLEQAKASEQAEEVKQNSIQQIEQTLTLMAEIKQQSKDNQQLKQDINNAPQQQQEVLKNIEQLKQMPAENEDLKALNSAQLQKELAKVQENLQGIQTELAEINSRIVNQRVAPERAQSTLSKNVVRAQEIEKLLFSKDLDELEKNKLQAEAELIKLQNQYSQTMLAGDSALLTLYMSQLEQKNLLKKQQEQQQAKLQAAINEKKLLETQQQVEQLKQSQQEEITVNPIIQKEQKINLNLSQDLIKQTTKLNTLTQDNLRIKSVLDNLQQTQRNITEQISALQGSLILSRIINKQKQRLPQDQLVNGLGKQITELRVKIFDLTELRDQLYNASAYIEKLSKKERVKFTEEEQKQLNDIVQERYRLVADEITLLNNQLNLSINIELNQKQVVSIGDALEDKLQQQSFWVRSNQPLNLGWFETLLPRVKTEVLDLRNAFSFTQWKNYGVLGGFMVFIALLLGGGILWQKPKITQHLKNINRYVNTLRNDKQRYTPEAFFWTIILAVPNTAFFFAVLIIVSTFTMANVESAWAWSFKMALFWLFFASMLAMLRPNGLAKRHFKISKNSIQEFEKLIKRAIPTCFLWLNASLLTHLEGGVTTDVIGEIVTIGVLAFTFFDLGPKIRQSFKLYQQELKIETGSQMILFKILDALTFLIPLGLIFLVVVGYYYTALNLMAHFIASYFMFMLWLMVKNIIYRELTVFSHHLSYRRLLEKQAQQAEQNTQTNNEIDPQFLEEEHIPVSKVKDQVMSVIDLGLLLCLCGLMYYVWADLLTVAYYLEGVSLWQQEVVTANGGTELQDITLWNLLIAMIMLLTTYALSRNISGVLEVLVFSRLKLSQGTPYTITTITIYFIIAIGLGASFATLGMSWSKLQWLFAALSVGLGFGLQEIFANFVSGIIILFERPVRIGDVVTIGDFSGKVSKIHIRSTTIIDFDNKEVIVPNKAFVTDRIVNWALTDSVTRVKILVGVAYGSDLPLVRKLLLEIAQECPLVLKDPEPKVYFLNFGASTLDHELRVYTKELGERNQAIDYINRRIDGIFAEHNINIAFNQLDVHIQNIHTEQAIKVATESFNYQK